MAMCGYAMSLSTKVAGAWKDISSVHIKVEGAWKPVINAWTKVGGVWKLVYSSLTAAITDPFLFGQNYILFPGTDATASVTAVLDVQGSGPFTYNWQLTGTHSYTSSPTGASFTISLQQDTPIETEGTVWCEVTDAYGHTVTTVAIPWTLRLEAEF